MKYKVIGWTSCDDCVYPSHKYLTEPLERAIIEDIKANGYCFGGDAHDRFCPVLNDGTRAIYSARSWGRVMGRAHGVYSGGYDYIHFYMDEFIDEKRRVYPKLYVDESLIMPREDLKDTFHITLPDGQFFAVRDGEMSVLVRPFDEQSKLFDVGDYIEFVRQGREDESVRMCVAGMNLAETFLKLLTCYVRNVKSNECKDEPCYDFTSLGISRACTAEEAAEYFLKEYGKEREKEFGAVAIEIKRPSHECKTYLFLKLKGIDDYRIDMGAYERMDNLGMAISAFTEDYVLRKYGYEIARNEEYDVDINNMVRKTIRNFVGKEKEIRQMLERFGAEMYLEIVPEIRADCDEPKPILSPDDDVIEFAYKSGVKLDIDYYVL